jgi:ABC-type antimicrobial peptide transport system permease subunit
LGARVFSAFGALALVLASLGLYGTLSSSVTERSHELGVRLALGAPRQHIARVILGRTLLVVASGLAIGILGVRVGGSIMDAVLFGVRSDNLAAVLTAAGALGAAAVLASVVPLRVALRVDVVEVLRR